jgi:hypothetical protein
MRRLLWGFCLQAGQQRMTMSISASEKPSVRRTLSSATPVIVRASALRPADVSQSRQAWAVVRIGALLDQPHEHADHMDYSAPRHAVMPMHSRKRRHGRRSRERRPLRMRRDLARSFAAAASVCLVSRVQAARTEPRNPVTSCFSRSLSLDSDWAAVRTCDDAVPVSLAARWMSTILAET